MKKVIAIACLIFIIAAVAIANTCGKRVKCVSVRQGIYEDKYEFKGIYLFDESVTYEGAVDKTYLYAENGQKVSNGSEIARGITSNKAGMMYIGLDGYEGKFTKDNIDEITLKDIKNIVGVKELKDGIKIIDNSSWYIYMLLDEDLADSIKSGLNKEMIIKDKYYPILIEKLYEREDGTFALIRVESDPDITDLRRGVTGYIIKSSYKGIIVPASAICQSEDKDGVYINYNGYTAFRKIQVLYKGEDVAVVAAEEGSGKLSQYDSVVKNPAGIKSGIRIK
jgi:putative membrane fusion protein